MRGKKLYAHIWVYYEFNIWALKNLCLCACVYVFMCHACIYPWSNKSKWLKLAGKVWWELCTLQAVTYVFQMVKRQQEAVLKELRMKIEKPAGAKVRIIAVAGKLKWCITAYSLFILECGEAWAPVHLFSVRLIQRREDLQTVLSLLWEMISLQPNFLVYFLRHVNEN